MIPEVRGLCHCPICDKDYLGNPTTDQVCMGCWTAERSEAQMVAELVELQEREPTGAGGWNFYQLPNTVRLMSRADVLDYLAEMPKDREIDRAVGHNSATPPANGIGVVIGWQHYHIFHNGWRDGGYHWAITPDGLIYIMRNLVYTGAHAHAEGNRGSMGWVMGGNFSGAGGLPTQAQQASAAFLCAAHRATFGYGCDQEWGHRWVDLHPTSCPGTNLSLEHLRSFVCKEPEQEEENMGFAATTVKMRAGDQYRYSAWLSHANKQLLWVDVTSDTNEKSKFRFQPRRDNGHWIGQAETDSIEGESITKRWEIGEFFNVREIGGLTLKMECLEGEITVKFAESAR